MGFQASLRSGNYSRLGIGEEEGGAGGTGTLTTATANPPASEVRHPSQLLPELRHIHLVEVERCEDTRPKEQLEASKQQHLRPCRHFLRASAQVTLHTVLIGVGGIIYAPHTSEHLKELGLDNYTATKLALKLLAHSACELGQVSKFSTGRAIEQTLNSHHQDQARATASSSPDPY
eukprot:1143446-Pelagomonas_calceolata.AAC.1